MKQRVNIYLRNGEMLSVCVSRDSLFVLPENSYNFIDVYDDSRSKAYSINKNDIIYCESYEV